MKHFMKYISGRGTVEWLLQGNMEERSTDLIWHENSTNPRWLISSLKCYTIWSLIICTAAPLIVLCVFVFFSLGRLQAYQRLGSCNNTLFILLHRIYYVSFSSIGKNKIPENSSFYFSALLEIISQRFILQ